MGQLLLCQLNYKNNIYLLLSFSLKQEIREIYKALLEESDDFTGFVTALVFIICNILYILLYIL